MTVTLGTDELSTSLNPAAIKADGYGFVMLYSRVLTPGIAQGYLAAGLGVVPIDESLANRSLSGAAGGTADGQSYAAFLASISQPAGTLAAVNLADFAAAPGDIDAIAAYWSAFIAQAHNWQLIGYGTGWVINQLAARGINTKYWQNPMDDNGWPGSTLAAAAQMVQRVAHTLPTISGVLASDYDEDAYYGTGLNFWGVTPPLGPDPVSGSGAGGDPPLLNGCVGLLNTPSGQGYWLVQPDGGVFTHGDAKFYGSAGSMKLNAPIVGAAARPQGDGYWLVGADGGVFSFGSAVFKGSVGGTTLVAPMTGITATPSGGGYRLVDKQGHVYDFGDAAFEGAGQ